MPDLDFTSKGAAKAEGDLEKIRKAGHQVAEEYKTQAQMLREINREFNAGLSPLEALRAKAASLSASLKNAELPDPDKNKASAALKRINEEIADIEENSKSAGTAMDGAFAQVGKLALGTLATAGGLAAGAVKILNDELRASQELINKSTMTQISISASRDLITDNMSGESDEALERVMRENQELSRRAGVSESHINVARADALAAAGGDLEKSYSAVEYAAALNPHAPEAISTTAMAMIDTGKATGFKDARANAGYLGMLGSVAHVSDQRQLAINAPKGLAGASQYGIDPTSNAALWAAISNQTNDQTGATSTSALLNFTSRLAVLGDKDRAGSNFIPELEGLKSFEERLGALRANPAAAKRAADNLTGPEEAKAPLRSLIMDPNSAMAREYESYRAKLGGSGGEAGFRAEGDRMLERRERNRLGARAALNRTIETAVESQRLKADQQYLTDDEVAGIKEIMQQGGMGSWSAGTEISLARGWDRKLSAEEAAELIRRRSTALGVDALEASDPNEAARYREQSKEFMEISKALRQGNDKIAELLERQIKATEESGGLTGDAS